MDSRSANASLEEDMEERVAKAIYEAVGDEIILWGDFPDDQKAIFRLEARAAIAALREPTEAMWDAGEATGEYGGIADNGGLERNDFDPHEVWSAMIDAALTSRAKPGS